jgi:hypothetical protein
MHALLQTKQHRWILWFLTRDCIRGEVAAVCGMIARSMHTRESPKGKSSAGPWSSQDVHFGAVIVMITLTVMVTVILWSCYLSA